jgi:hypothetical protein
MARLTDYLRGYAPFEQVVARGGAAAAGAGAAAGLEVAVPTFAHAYVTAGLLQHRPWSQCVVLAVVSNQEAAGDLGNRG